MTEHTSIVGRAKASHIMSVSIRGWIALMIAGTLCFCASYNLIMFQQWPAGELFALFGYALRDYIAQNEKPKEQQPPPTA